MIQGKVSHVTSNDGVRFWSGFSPNDPNNVPDSRATLEVGVLPLSPELRAKLASMIPAEVQAAECMGLGRVRVAYSLAGLCDEVYVANPYRNPGSIPAEIRERFRFLVSFTMPVRWGRIGLVWKAEFLATNGARLPIFSLKTVSPQYYHYSWHRDYGFQLADSDLAGAQFLSLQARFNALVPHFGQQLLQGAALETDPEGAKAGAAAVLAMVAQARTSKQQVVRAETDAFLKPGS
jgi:hypothetical protein